MSGLPPISSSPRIASAELCPFGGETSSEEEQTLRALGTFTLAITALMLSTSGQTSLRAPSITPVIGTSQLRPPVFSRSCLWGRSIVASLPPVLEDSKVVSAVESFLEPVSGVMSIDQPKRWLWIMAHEEKYHLALTKLVATITIVSHKCFVGALETCINRVGNRVAVDRAILVEEGKSNLWVAQLAKKYCGFEGPRLPLGSKEASAILASGGPLDRVKDHSRWPSDFVLFDDGSYSGKQITDHVSCLARYLIGKVTKPTRIVVIIPFMTQIARDKLEKLRESYENRGQVKIRLAPYHLMPTLLECMEKDPELLPLRELYTKEGYAHPEHFTEPTGIALHLFAHKVPNSMSFPEPLAQASVYPADARWRGTKPFIPPVIPPYKVV